MEPQINTDKRSTAKQQPKKDKKQREPLVSRIPRKQNILIQQSSRRDTKGTILRCKRETENWEISLHLSSKFTKRRKWSRFRYMTHMTHKGHFPHNAYRIPNRAVGFSPSLVTKTKRNS
ncbi:MAG: hypothetical protein C4532_14980 [Candidatus Abyssobacteria bacterium SURF_17]|jgi:hypothetical protein|uniref:Uncharacterized protein n=1 Tax=Candidatus Abyssobacteria bacterium SURF_17 TaxID=2093361 RepID=A0A419ETJ7_9BACT|nr:MAG: hypothetical protein C4532_14980 [Candidatus Abyssubacteria bacterium SURF_17]